MLKKRGIRLFGQLHRFEQIFQRLFRLVRLKKDPSQAVEISRVFRFVLERLFDHLSGLGEVPAVLGPHVTQVIEGFGKIRRKLQTFLEGFFGLCEIAFAFVSGSQIEIEMLIQPFRVGGLGDHFGCGIMLNGLVERFLLTESDTAQILLQEVLGEFCARLLQRAQRIAGSFQTDLHAGEIIVSRRKIRIQQECLSEVLRGFFQVILLQRKRSQRVIGLSIGRVICNNPLQFFAGEFVFAIAQINFRQTGAHSVAQARHLRHLLEQLLVKLRRPL